MYIRDPPHVRIFIQYLFLCTTSICFFALFVIFTHYLYCLYHAEHFTCIQTFMVSAISDFTTYTVHLLLSSRPTVLTTHHSLFFTFICSVFLVVIPSSVFAFCVSPYSTYCMWPHTRPRILTLVLILVSSHGIHVKQIL